MTNNTGYTSKTSITAQMERDKKMVVKANKLVEAKYQMTVREQKVFLYMISKINPQNQELEKYQINIKEPADIINPKETKWGNIYADFAATIHALKKITISISDGTKKHIVSLINDVTTELVDGTIIYEISPHLKPYLIQIQKKFTMYKYYNVAYLKSKFSIRFYEVLKQYEKIGNREFTVDQIRELLQIKESNYKLYSNIKNRIILTAQKELQAKTDIGFTFTETKQGRRVVKIRFDIFKNKQFVPPKKNRKNKALQNEQMTIFQEQQTTGNSSIELLGKQTENYVKPRHKKTALTSEQVQIIKQIMSMGITERDAQALCKHAYKTVKQKNIAQYVNNKIKVFQYQKSKKDIRNPAGFLRKAIDENYRDEAREKEELQRQQRYFHNKRMETLEKLEKQKDQLKKEREEMLLQITTVALQHKPKEKIKAIEQYRIEYQQKIEKKQILLFPYKENLTPEENYNDNLMIRWHCYKYIAPQFPKQFEPVEKNFQLRIQEIEAQIAKTKAMEWQPNNTFS